MINSACHSLPRLEINAAASFLQAGGLLIYPTETFLAIGSLPFLTDGIDAIYQIKGRTFTKPLPLLAGSLEQASSIADVEYVPQGLIDTFWPGPLTILLPAKKRLPPHLLNDNGKVAVRVTGSPLARCLTEKVGSPITCTSANIQAHKPGQTLDEFDMEFWQACKMSDAPVAIFNMEDHSPHACMPSTIIEPQLVNGVWKMHIIREGAIPANKLEDWASKGI